MSRSCIRPIKQDKAKKKETELNNAMAEFKVKARTQLAPAFQKNLTPNQLKTSQNFLKSVEHFKRIDPELKAVFRTVDELYNEFITQKQQ